MLRNYLKIAFRNLYRRKVFSCINISGLGIGIASCLLILLYVADELSYDRFLKNAPRIYRVTTHLRTEGKATAYATAPPPLAEAIRREFPEVQAVTRVLRWNDFTMRPESGVNRQKSFREKRVYYAESSFFEVFSYKLLAGDPATALAQPYSVVLTAAAARKYFGDQVRWNEVLGKNLLVGQDPWPCRITGVVETPPAQSHFHFDMLLYEPGLHREIFGGGNWSWAIVHTYLLLNPAGKAESLEQKMQSLVAKYAVPAGGEAFEKMLDAGGRYAFGLQAIADIHLHSDLLREMAPNGQAAHVYIFTCVALFIVLIACVNFTNLTTAQAAQRAREVGVRKVLGSQKGDLVRQFLLESLLLSLLSTILALGLTRLAGPAFNQLTGKELAFNPLLQPWVLAGIAGLMLFTGLLAGTYPAFYLTAFRPVEVLKGTRFSGGGKYNLRNVLVVFQFALSTGLIICTLLVYGQLRFISQKHPGFEKENVLVIHNGGEINADKKEAFTQALLQEAALRSVSFTTSVPARQEFHMRHFNVEHSRQGYGFNWYQADEGYLRTMGLQLVAGRGFARHLASDTAAVLLNESAVRAMGLLKPVGTHLILNEGSNDEARLQVIGVVKDFHFESYHQRVKPLAIQYFHNVYLDDYILVQLAAGKASEGVAAAKARWQAFQPHVPFTYSFLDADFEALFRAEARLGRVMAVFTGLAIFTACLGLFGLVAFATRQRVKEIGIRKILGAPVHGIVLLLSKDFLKLIGVAFLVAIPAAWYVMHGWLQDFAYHISVRWWVFVLAGGVSLLIALLTISLQAIRAALANPVDSLRSE
jgi:putative ABC transport system permease protein